MGKTISLKLNSREEEIISSLRKKGTSPSAIIREAFWNYVQKHEAKNREKPYDEVNQVNLDDDYLQEKVVNHQVNRMDKPFDPFLEQYIDQLHIEIKHLENEINDWKTQYTIETQYWKDAYQLLQGEYQNQVKELIKCIDKKFERIMFYIEESSKTLKRNFEISKQVEISSEKQNKEWTSHMIRM